MKAALAEVLAAVRASASQPVMRTSIVPQPRALRPVQLTERAAQPAAKPSGLRSVIRRSVGIDE
jgi:hypothetical protein